MSGRTDVRVEALRVVGISLRRRTIGLTDVWRDPRGGDYLAALTTGRVPREASRPRIVGLRSRQERRPDLEPCDCEASERA